MGHLFAQADALRIPLADKSVAVTVGSPPYADARSYLEDGENLGISRDADEWVSWMLDVTTEALRVSWNCVVWVAAGVTRDRNYWPICEGLMWEWRKRGGSMYRPVFWHRVGIPGSGHNDWFRHDVEFCCCFKRPGELPFADNTACGHPPKWAPGGEMSNRVKDGDRRNQWGKHENSTNSQRKADGEFQGHGRPSHVYLKRMKGLGHEGGGEQQGYAPPSLANPGTLLKTSVGGGQMGHALAHANEAPYPESVPEFFIKSLTRPGDTVLDVFSGSGTTVATADRLGRHGIGFDLRRSQCEIGMRRLTRPHAKVQRPHRREEPLPLFAGADD